MDIPPLKHALSLLKRLRWFLMLVILVIALAVAWYGWQRGGGLVWIVFGGMLLLLVVVGIWGGKMTSWLARRLEHRILRNQRFASRRLVNAGLQQGEKLARLGGKELEKNIDGARQALGQALNNFGQGSRVKPGKVTWVKVPPPHYPNDVCPACGKGVRSGANYCDHCGKPIKRF